MRPYDLTPKPGPDTNESTPLSFNPAQYRILATHWPGVPPPPWQHVDAAAAAIVADLSHRHRSDKAQAPRLDDGGGVESNLARGAERHQVQA